MKSSDALIVKNAELREQIKELRAEVASLRSKLVAAADKIADDDERIARLQRMQDGAFE